jgi:hypothetical protein
MLHHVRYALLRLLCLDLGVLLDGDVLVGLEGGDEVVGQLGAGEVVSVWIYVQD